MAMFSVSLTPNFYFCSSRAKGMKILNLTDAQTTNGVASALQDDDDAVDPHLERIKNAAGDESDEEVPQVSLHIYFLCTNAPCDGLLMF